MMPRRMLAVVSSLVVLAVPGPAGAGAFLFSIAGGGLVAVGAGAGAAVVAGLSVTMGAGMFPRTGGPPQPSLLVVEATPLDADIRLDGKAVGTARERASYALDLAPGRHTITITAPGYKPLTGRFVADPDGFTTKIRATLVPE